MEPMEEVDSLDPIEGAGCSDLNDHLEVVTLSLATSP